MTREEFLRRLAAASTRAIAFARELVEDAVPDTYLVDVHVVSHEDGRVDPPLETLWGRSHDGWVCGLSNDQVAEALWHDGRVPEWIDLAVSAVEDDVTYLELRCSRTVASDGDLWYPRDLPPFKIAGPYLPSDFVAEHTDSLGRFAPNGAKFALPPRTIR